MNIRRSFRALWILVILGVVGSVDAKDNAWRFDVDASVGAQYDSNVGITDLDVNSGKADSVLLLAGGGSLTWDPAANPFKFRVGYDFSGLSYARFDEFDLDLHHGLAELRYHHDRIDTALTLDRFEGVLDGEHYVSITQVSPSLARLFGQRVYARGALIASMRDYKSLPDRNARKSAIRVDTYLLLDKLDRYVSVGVQLNDESADSQEFEYKGFQVHLKYVHTFELLHLNLKFKAGLRYEDRDYEYVTAVIGERRRDQRWRVGLGAEIPLTKNVSLLANMEHTDDASNLDAAALEKTVAGLELRLAF